MKKGNREGGPTFPVSMREEEKKNRWRGRKKARSHLRSRKGREGGLGKREKRHPH